MAMGFGRSEKKSAKHLLTLFPKDFFKQESPLDDI